MKSTFRILFYAKWEASDETKMLPIYVRITINGTKARFSLKIRVSEKIWDAKSGRLVQRLSPRRPKSHWTQLNLDRCMDLEDRGLMTDAGRSAFERAFDYKAVTPDSEMNQLIEEENKLRRPKLYK